MSVLEPIYLLKQTNKMRELGQLAFKASYKTMMVIQYFLAQAETAPCKYKNS